MAVSCVMSDQMQTCVLSQWHSHINILIIVGTIIAADITRDANPCVIECLHACDYARLAWQVCQFMLTSLVHTVCCHAYTCCSQRSWDVM